MNFISPGSLPYKKVDYTAHFWITLPDKTRLAASLWLPVTSEKRPVPALLEYNANCKAHASLATDESNHPYLAGHGYACIRVDMRGIGNSDGIPTDKLDPLHIDDAVAVIEWISKQPWCSGAVGMFGLGEGATTALRVAARRPAALNAIVSICGTDDPYLDGTDYKGGVLIPESALHKADVRAADPLIVIDQWQENWVKRLEGAAAFIHESMKHPNRDDYWQQASLMDTPEAINIPILLFSGWYDPHVNATLRMANTFSAPLKCVIGPWSTQLPHLSSVGPNIGLLQEMRTWFDSFLKNEGLSAATLPKFRFYMMDSFNPFPYVNHRSGTWYEDTCWPPEDHINDLFYIHGKTLSYEIPPNTDNIIIPSDASSGIDQGEYDNPYAGHQFAHEQVEEEQQYLPGFVGDDRVTEKDVLVTVKRSFYSDTPELEDDYVITGAPIFECSFTSSEPQAQLHVRLCDVSSSGVSRLITYGVMNLNHSEDHEYSEALRPDVVYRAKVILNATAYTIPAGNRLRIALSTRSTPIFLPSPIPSIVTIIPRVSTLTVPNTVVSLEPLNTPFQDAKATLSQGLNTVIKPKFKYDRYDDQSEYEYVFIKKFNHGQFKNEDNSLVTGHEDSIEVTCAKAQTYFETRGRGTDLVYRKGKNACASHETTITGLPDRLCLRTEISATLNVQPLYNRIWKIFLNRELPEPYGKEATAYINYMKRLCQVVGIKVRIHREHESITRTLHGHQQEVIAYFDPDAPGGPIFAYANQASFSVWFPMVVKEFQSVEQWLESFPPTHCNKEYNLISRWLDYKLDMNKKTLHWAINSYRLIEADAGRRALEAIERYHLPIDARAFAKYTNSYLYMYQYIERYRQLPSERREPFTIALIMDKMPDHICESYDTVDEEIMALYVEAFPPVGERIRAPKQSCTIM